MVKKKAKTQRKKAKSPNKKQGTPRMRPPGFKKYYVTNSLTGYTNFDFRIELMNEKVKSDKPDDWMYIVETLLMLTPNAAKKLSKQLSETVAAYEKEYGKIEELEAEGIIG